MINAAGRPVRLAELLDAGIDVRVVRAVVQEGRILNPVKGIYCDLGNYDPFLHALACLRVHGTDYVLCLKSAAQYHGLIGNVDSDLWVAAPVGRGILAYVGDYRAVPIHWNGMQAPSAPMDVPLDSEADVDLGRLEQTERYFGIWRQVVGGVEIKVTSPARTVVDLLRYMERPVAKERVDGLCFDQATAFEALATFVRDNDVDMVAEIADRLGCTDQIEVHVALARSFQVTVGRRF